MYTTVGHIKGALGAKASNGNMALDVGTWRAVVSEKADVFIVRWYNNKSQHFLTHRSVLFAFVSGLITFLFAGRVSDAYFVLSRSVWLIGEPRMSCNQPTKRRADRKVTCYAPSWLRHSVYVRLCPCQATPMH